MPPYVFVPTATRPRVPPDCLVTSTPPTLLETVPEHGIGSVFRQNTDVFWRAEDVVHANGLTAGDRFWKTGVPSEEEYAGIITDGAGGSVKLGGHGFVALLLEARGAHLEFIPAVHIFSNRENATVRSAKKLLTVPKESKKAAEVGSAGGMLARLPR